MRCTRTVIGIVTFAIVAMHASADVTRTFGIEIHAESAALDPGAGKFATEIVYFVDGCQYVRHEIEVVEEFPILSTDRNRNFRETLQRDETGKIVHLLVTASAYRSLLSERGPASITIKLSVVISCDESSLAKMQQNLERNGWEVGQ